MIRKNIVVRFFFATSIFFMCSNFALASNIPVGGWFKEGYTYVVSDQEREGRQMACEKLSNKFAPILTHAYNAQLEIAERIDKYHDDFRNSTNDVGRVSFVYELVKLVNGSSKKIDKVVNNMENDENLKIDFEKDSDDTIAIKEPGLYEQMLGGGNIRRKMDRKRAHYYAEEYKNKKLLWMKIVDNQKASIREFKNQFKHLMENDTDRKARIRKNRLVDEEGFDLPGLDENSIIVGEHNAQYSILQTAIRHEIDNTKDLIELSGETNSYFDKLDVAFEKETSMSKEDYLVLLLASVLQVARQNLVLLVPRMDDQTSANTIKNSLGLPKVHSNREYGYYNPSFSMVLTNPEPYDVIRGSAGRLGGYGQMGHRAATLGHDSILGLIVGTANIATGTVTTSDLMSYHITTIDKVDAFGNNASTGKVFYHFLRKVTSKNIDDKKIVALAFAKQLIHMLTDVQTKNSLPIPFIGLCDGVAKRWLNNPIGLGNKLSTFGMDVSKGVLSAGGAFAINRLVEWLHYALCYDGTVSEDMFKVRTKKIVCYSNLIASGINAVESLALHNPKMIDLSGYLISVMELVTSVKFQKQIKRDFVFGEYDAALIKYCCESSL